jgi:hypothetical protein
LATAGITTHIACAFSSTISLKKRKPVNKQAASVAAVGHQRLQGARPGYVDTEPLFIVLLLLSGATLALAALMGY